MTEEVLRGTTRGVRSATPLPCLPSSVPPFPDPRSVRLQCVRMDRGQG